MPMKIGILGLTGVVSRLVIDAVKQAPDLVLAGGTLHAGSAKAPPPGIEVFPDVASLAAASDVLVDFTHGSAAQSHAQGLKDARCAWVLGT